MQLSNLNLCLTQVCMSFATRFFKLRKIFVHQWTIGVKEKALLARIIGKWIELSTERLVITKLTTLAA